MRWKSKKPVLGQKRVIIKFLWFPTTIEEETRWLEIATIEQIYSEAPIISFHWGNYFWKNIEFINIKMKRR